MYWLQPPSIVRRIAAIAMVVGAVLWDLRGGATVAYPIASGPIDAGTTIDTGHLAWVDIPADVLPGSEPLGSVTAVAIGAGEPLTPAVLSGPVAAPDGWWTIPIAIGTLAAPGDEAMLVVTDPAVSVVGIVIESQVGDPFDLGHRPAAVAVPPDTAPLVAAAAQQGLLVTAIRATPRDR